MLIHTLIDMLPNKLNEVLWSCFFFDQTGKQMQTPSLHVAAWPNALNGYKVATLDRYIQHDQFEELHHRKYMYKNECMK